MSFSITVLIIIITVLVSVSAFGSRKIMDDLIFYPAHINRTQQYYRFLTYGFIHADLMHLLFNMYAFYLFGEFTEKAFLMIFGDPSGKVMYVLMYFLALIVCVIPDFKKHKNNDYYRSLGASGAVSAIVFAYILLNPLQGIGLIFIPFFIPGFLFGILYVVVSYYLGKKGGTNINHNAHLWGALFGVVFLLVASELFSDFPVLDNFISQVKNMKWDQLFQTY
ncbi:MAG: rhomboid family intramembrane serine protease [Chitinophagaceae bacterium]|nr:rhomboid family intramembrane serine protease [Chitinophagaceae bacterium]